MGETAVAQLPGGILMIRSALTLSAGLLAAVCFACVAVVPPLPPPRVAAVAEMARSGLTLACDETGAAAFLGKVFMLTQTVPPFNPTARGNHYAPPQQAGPVVDPMRTDLHDAFCVAPKSFQEQLNSPRLTAVFIDPASCAGSDCIGHLWGYRERQDQAPGTGRYIGLSIGLWNGGANNAVPYRAFETALLQQLLAGWQGPIYPSDPDSPTDTSRMTVLAMLAHEYGHILWYDILKPSGSGDDYHYENLCGGNFFTGSWRSRRPMPQPIWRQFQSYRVRAGNPVADRHLAPPDIAAIDNALSQAEPDFDTVSEDLVSLYGASYPWATFFGALSPDEDFVETFKFLVLTGASPPLTSLPLVVPLGEITAVQNIPLDYSRQLKTELKRKTDCIAGSM
jgi:hypothetical protein